MSRRYAAIVFLVAACSCRPSNPPPPPPASPTNAPAPAAGTREALRDWTAAPPDVAAERGAPCPRLLSAAPNITEICCALGLAEHLVGRTRYCTHPPAVRNIPSIGDLYNLNDEVLIELRPQRVLVAGRSRTIAERLTRLGVPHEAMPDVTLEDLFVSIQRIGELSGRTETAQRLIAGIRADLDAAARRCETPPARVLVLTGPLSDPPSRVHAAGPGSFYDDLLRLAGHRNIVAADRAFSPVSLEFVLAADPDVIIELVADPAARPDGDADAVRVWSRLGPLRAVEERRVHVLCGEQHFLLGPRIAQTFEALCRRIAGMPDD